MSFRLPPFHLTIGRSFMVLMHHVSVVLLIYASYSPVFASSNNTFQFPNELGFEAELSTPQQAQLIQRLSYQHEHDTDQIVIMSTTYNEDVIVDLFTQVFDLNNKLCYIPRESIMYPEETSTQPAGSKPRHEFTPAQRAEFEEWNLEPRLVSLLERIPYQRDSFHDQYILWDYATMASTPYGLGLSHRRLLYGNEEWPFGKTEIALMVTYERDGRYLVLDVEDNTLRDWDIYDGYRPTRRAPDLLREWVEDIATLRVMGWQEDPGSDRYSLIDAPRDFDPSIPITDEEIEPLPPGTTDWEECELRKYKFLNRTLEQEYGWPDDFQQERWKERHEEVWREAARRYEPFS